MTLLLSNLATSELAAGIAADATSITVQPGDGAKFPVPNAAGEWFPLLLVAGTGMIEIVRCTARFGDTLTIQRAQEGTSAKAFAAGDRVDLRLTAAAAASKLDKSGGVMSGPLEIDSSSFISIRSTEDSRFSWSVDVSDIRIGFYWNAEEGIGSQGYKFRVAADGTVWTAQLGDLASHIANGLAGKVGTAGDWTMSGTLRLPVLEIDAAFQLREEGGTPVINFDAADYISYDRVNNWHQFIIAGTERLRIGNGIDLLGGPLTGASMNANQLTGTVADARLPETQSRKRLEMSGSGIGAAQAFQVAALEIFAGAGWEAFIGFHRGGIAAATLGLGGDNNMRIGFNNNTSAIIWHEQNFNPAAKADTGTVGRGANLIESAALRLDQNGTVDLADPYFMVGARCAIISGVSHLVLRALTGVK